jgi:hypothetical protein
MGVVYAAKHLNRAIFMYEYFRHGHELHSVYTDDVGGVSL